MTWANQRRLIIAITVFLPLILIIVLIIMLQKPEQTCFDRKQNQDEEGIDCGGICGNVCQDLIPQPITEWTRFFNVIDNYYAVATRIKHPDPNLFARSVPYFFKFYDSEGILIAEQPGVMDFFPLPELVVFETGIKMGNRIPARAVFELIDNPYWEQTYKKSPTFETLNTSFDHSASGPRVTARVRMSGEEVIHDVIFIALLYDAAGIVYQASQTYIERMDENTPISLSFTWPQILPVEPTHIEIAVSSYK